MVNDKKTLLRLGLCSLIACLFVIAQVLFAIFCSFDSPRGSPSQILGEKIVTFPYLWMLNETLARLYMPKVLNPIFGYANWFLVFVTWVLILFWLWNKKLKSNNKTK